jgi:hypothetical protein
MTTGRPMHVIGREGEAVFLLNCPRGPIALRESYRFSASEIRRIAGELTTHIPSLCTAWETIHGDF